MADGVNGASGNMGAQGYTAPSGPSEKGGFLRLQEEQEKLREELKSTQDAMLEAQEKQKELEAVQNEIDKVQEMLNKPLEVAENKKNVFGKAAESLGSFFKSIFAKKIEDYKKALDTPIKEEKPRLG